ncbi:protein fam204a-like isoform x1 [Plakobranchus ocellatus]|uniref:Protein fam204a-like isoform x1 n=1 Tax=Plakobranchus ocellatus TaxID=259542 RepID=A0AAV4DCY7_9GAST|nr:protein fam204a-like isoform x1 [Plakobranchus ocellatus]
MISSNSSESSKNETASTEKDKKPKNVPVHLWEKFKSLEKRTNETTQRSTEKRIKHLQKTILKTVSKELSSSGDREILREHDVTFDVPMQRGQKRKIIQEVEDDSASGSIESSSDKTEILNLMKINDHLQTTDFSKPPPETALEKQLASAIKEGHFSTAEAISDKIATLEAGEKVAAAFDAKRFLQRKKEEKETAKIKMKKKLNWGFEPKQRWETKGNM